MGLAPPPATDGELAVRNHESLLDRCWTVFRRWPDRLGTAALIVAEEDRRIQFLGDMTALDRLRDLVAEQPKGRPESFLAAAHAATIRHHFDEAMIAVDMAEAAGAPADEIMRLRLTVAQATGDDLPAVSRARHALAEDGRLENLVPLGAVLADLGHHEAADAAYVQAYRTYRDLSPFALAWVCFQAGVLWGEIVPEPEPARAAAWYRQAIAYLPAYTHARVHLAEILTSGGDPEAAEAILRPVMTSGDPEVPWRMANALFAQGRSLEAEAALSAAHARFEALLTHHERAFADHAAEFYLDIGRDPPRAQELALLNLANRRTPRALALARAAGCPA